MWNTSLLPRVELVTWRVCQNALPTRVELKKHIERLDAVCRMCGRGEESTLYALKECSLARPIWDASVFAS